MVRAVRNTMVVKTWFTIREFVLERDNYTCQDCGALLFSPQLHVHHIKEQWDGGSDEESNLITLCPQCHISRHKETKARWQNSKGVHKRKATK